MQQDSILVVDDDRGILDTFAAILNLEGFKVLAVGTGAAAIQASRDAGISLALVDLRLPDMTGLDLLREMRRIHIYVPVIIMSGFASTASAVEAGRMGVSEFLEKPIDEAQLRRAVRGHFPNTSNRHAAAALSLLADQYTDPTVTLRGIARAVNLSPWHLTRLLKQTTGAGFHATLHRLRVTLVAELLTKSHLSVKEIADRVGYSNTRQLERHFMRIHAQTPTAYRNCSATSNPSTTNRGRWSQ
jgi:YesN/AraC family two-component response regulator